MGAEELQAARSFLANSTDRIREICRNQATEQSVLERDIRLKRNMKLGLNAKLLRLKKKKKLDYSSPGQN